MVRYLRKIVKQFMDTYIYVDLNDLRIKQQEENIQLANATDCTSDTSNTYSTTSDTTTTTSTTSSDGTIATSTTTSDTSMSTPITTDTTTTTITTDTTTQGLLSKSKTSRCEDHCVCTCDKEKEPKTPTRNRRSARSQTKKTPRKKLLKTEKVEEGPSQNELFDPRLWTMLLDLENMEYTPINSTGLDKFTTVAPKNHKHRVLSNRSSSLNEFESKKSKEGPYLTPRGRPTPRGKRTKTSRSAHSHHNRSASCEEHPSHKTTNEFPEIPAIDCN